MRQLVFACVALSAALVGIAVADPYHTMVTVPLYGAGFVPAGVAVAQLPSPPAVANLGGDPQVGGDPPAAPAAPVQAAGESQLDRIERKLDRILKFIDDNVGGAAEPADKKPAGPKPPADLQAAANKCAKCHHANVAEAKGGGFAMFKADGSLESLADRDRKRAVAKVKNGTMPPPDSGLKLSDGEKAALTGLLEAKK